MRERNNNSSEGQPGRPHPSLSPFTDCLSIGNLPKSPVTIKEGGWGYVWRFVSNMCHFQLLLKECNYCV